MIDLDHLLKVFQIIFYCFMMCTIFVYYRSVKKLTMNFTNGCYSKEVVESLRDLSNALYSEFDAETKEYWAKQTTSQYIMHQLNERFAYYADDLLTGKVSDNHLSIPMTEVEKRIIAMADRCRSDPFLPQSIRSHVVSMLDERANALTDAYRDTANFYMSKLVNKEVSELSATNEMSINNYLIVSLNKKGFGISQVEGKVAEIRIQIQNFLSGLGSFQGQNVTIPTIRYFG